mmetsp:Transcript_23688/g.55262  ORF Transcript_23688/g.55262 Transcript_23688/m.55262 type:complete len:265 (-) Transcript_23688:36-830(-)
MALLTTSRTKLLDEMSNDDDDVLASFSERFQGFEKQLALEARARHEAHETELGGLRSNIERLQNTLNVEAGRSAVDERELQDFFEKQVASVQESLESAFLDRIDQLYSAADSLNDRLLLVEKEFSQAQENYLQEFQDRSTAVQSLVTSMHSSFESECQNRLQREEILVARTLDLEARTAEKLAQERRMREQKFNLLQADMQDSERIRTSADQRFAQKVQQKLQKHRADLAVEVESRQKADNEIVLAIQYYTQALQEAVKIGSNV